MHGHRSIEWAIGSIIAFLRKRGWDDTVRELVDEFWELDKACLLAELRLVLLRADFPLDVVAKFDRTRLSFPSR